MTFHHLLRHSLIPVSFIQTLTTLNLTDNRIEDQGAQYLGEVLQHNTVRSSLLLIFSLISFFSLSYRHSLHSTLTATESKIKVHNTWVKHCDTIQWDHHSSMFLPSSHSYLFHTDTHYTQPAVQSNRRSRCTILGWSIATQYSEIITSSYFLPHLILLSLIQTLTTLNLSYNQIGAQGAQYLGEALRHNTVRSSLLLIFSIISLLSLSYRHSLHSTCRKIKSELKVRYIWSACRIQIAISKWFGDSSLDFNFLVEDWLRICGTGYSESCSFVRVLYCIQISWLIWNILTVISNLIGWNVLEKRKVRWSLTEIVL